MSDQVKDNESSVSGLIIISFPWGLPGLEYYEFSLSFSSPDSPFCILRSTAQPEVSLLLLDPFVVYKDYEFEINDEIAGQLKIADEKQVAVFCTVNTSRGVNSATVNLLAPIVVNTERLLAKQVVLNDKRHSLRAPLILKMDDAEKEEE